MSNNNNKQPLDLTDSLPVAPESQLKAIRGQDSDVLQNLKPGVTKRVEVLRGIQREHDELESKVFEERAALEARYLKLSAPLYSKRYDIVTGTVEVDGAMEEDAMDQTDDTEKGVPEFWLTAMKHNNEFCPYYSRYTISERDEEALKYLKDIKWCHMDDPKGFKLEFFFDTNPFFTNSVVTKVYHMTSSYYFDKLILVKTIGTTIEWLPEKCLTQKIFQMKPKKGSKNAQPITKTEDCESFFNFFSPLEVPANEEEIEEDMANKLQDQIEQDYNIGLIIRDKIIPHAVSCFMGEAKQEDFGEETKAKKKSQLKAIGGQDSDVLKNLKPAVRKRVEVLRGIQSEHDELESKIFEERAALEARYQKLSAPLYSKRYDIVTGAVEVDGAKEEDTMDQADDTEKGVPEFWLTAMKHNIITAEEIKEQDEEALKYLKDIKWCRMDDSKGFKLEFLFDTNPFFKNSVLTKEYHMISSCYFYLHIFEEAIGTTIEWLPGKCLTQKIIQKKNQTWFRRKHLESFFNFFSDLVDEKRQDYNIGLTIRDKIIPHAVSCFTGEANQGVLQGIVNVDDDDDEIEEDDDDDDEDDDEDDEDEEETKTKKKSQLKAIGGQDSDVLKNLKPAVRKRVEVLRGIQSKHDELEAKFFEEKANYQKLYASFYSKRYDIVTGAVEVEGAKEEDTMDQTEDTEKGVPKFWLTAMKHNKITAKEITERDEEALKYLKDIKWCRMDDPKGFKLEFFFDTNPFFANSVLTKAYHMRSSFYYHKLLLEKEIGTTIEWLPGKCLTLKIVKMKPKVSSTFLLHQKITKTKGCESFFNFFSPFINDQGFLYAMQQERRQDYYIGLTIRDKIIPHAISCFTGEANQGVLKGFDDEDDEDEEDEEEIKNRKKSQLKAIGGQDSDVLENLKPEFRKRVEILRGIQSEHDELESKVFEEEAKYQKLYAPLYSKRYDIVTGAVEVDGAKEEDAMDETNDTEKGVPEFWLTAMKHNKFCLCHLRYTITKRDEGGLKYLKDIKWCRMDDPKGFKLEFFFDTNPFFTNSVLTKIYHMRSSCYFDKLILEKAIGTTIEWLPRKCLTHQIFQMKPKVSSTFLAHQKIKKTEGCDSFFNFFSPPEVKRYLMREDYNIGLTIRDKIIPHAVSWFTGEANQEDFGGFDDEEDEGDEHDDEDGVTPCFAGYNKFPNRGKKLGIPKSKKRVDKKNLGNSSQPVEASTTTPPVNGSPSILRDFKSVKTNNSCSIM